MLAGTSRSWLVGGAVVAASILGAFPLPCGMSPARETALSEAEARATIPDLDLRIETARRILRGVRSSEGSGASVANLIVIQTTYRDQDGTNTFLWVWDNPLPNPAGILLYVGEDPVLDERTGEPLVLDGKATSFVSVGKAEDNFGEGPVERTVEGNQVRSKDTLTGLRTQPFENPKVTCAEGPTQPGTNLCSLDLAISVSGLKPTYFSLSGGDGDPLDRDIPGDATEHSIPGLTAGEHCVQLTGWLERTGSHYLGDPVESCCTLECRDAYCKEPGGLAGCQTTFGPGAENSVDLTWANGVPAYEKLVLTVGGTELDPLEGTTQQFVLDGLSPGALDVKLQAYCGGDKDPAELQTLTIQVLASVPTVRPPENVSCKFTLSDHSKATITWRNVEPPQYFEIFIIDAEGGQRYAMTVAGQATGANVDGTRRGDSLGLRGVYFKDGACFPSDLLTCVPTLPPGFKYLASDCDGDGTLILTDGIFELNWLFKGGNEPPCPASCDANVDGLANIADAIYLLNHLFLSGPPPLGKYPGCDEGYPEDPLPCFEDHCS